MQALFFGSIGTIVETSELQREAFNDAFAAAGLDWSWDRDAYRAKLVASGGRDRIALEANRRGESVDAEAIHTDKTARFQALMRERGLTPRSGVAESLALARRRGVPTALVSTTARASLDEALAASGMDAEAFDAVASADDGQAAKPDSAAYLATLERLGVAANRTLAVEDNRAGLQSAHGAGLLVAAFLGENTRDHSIADANWSARDDIFPIVAGLIERDEA